MSPSPFPTDPLRVAITGAAGQIAYSLLYMIASGQVFGPNQPVILHLLDIPPAMDALRGVVMELEDGAFSLIHSIVATTNPLDAFLNIDWAIMLGAMPRREGQLRKDLLKANVCIFKEQGQALNQVAKKSVRVVVVGNPANTNALVASHYAPSIPPRNFSALTRLDENRARSQIANKIGLPVDAVRNVIVWGNHSNTQFPCADHAHIVVPNANQGSTSVSVQQVLGSDAPVYLQGDFIKRVALRGGAIIAARKLSSAMSAAKATADHVHDWYHGTPPGKYVSMAVMSDGTHYGIPADLMFSFPVTIDVATGDWHIVPNLSLSDFAQDKLRVTITELEEEKFEAHTHISDHAVADGKQSVVLSNSSPPLAAL